MGCRAQVLITGRPALADDAVRRLHELEARWSRFRRDSDVSRANRSSARPVSVHPDTVLLAEVADRATRMTAGRFDALLGATIESIGYDRDFARIDPDVPARTSAGTGCARLSWDADRSTITVSPGGGFDAGGIGKGLAADLVVDELLTAGADGALVNLGGDVRVAGRGPSAAGWVVSVADPFEPARELCRVSLLDGAVATSSRLVRAWQQGGTDMHHLIDPTSQPVGNGVAAATVIGATGWMSEAFTKAVFVAGYLEGPALLEQNDLEGVVVDDAGDLHWTAGLRASLV